ncbi:MAG: PepSY-like domain-containing protein [Paludibacteraceae bacterium]|nr:PepSY-like domain-containing protein [Paludibacteraceae bacterium]
MKKYFSVVLMALCSLTACAKEQVIAYDQVPEPAKAIVSAHFDASQISYVTVDKGLLDCDYDIKFNDGRSLEFNKAGELTKVDCQQTEVPSALIPERVRQYVKANFPNAFITEWSKDDRRWKAELNSGLDLEFNSKYEFVRIDD